MEKEERERILKSLYDMKNTKWFKAGSEMTDESDVRYREYLARKETLDRVHKIVVKEPLKRQKLHDCKYLKTKDGYVSGCGYRVAYNKFWHICPICGKAIIVINQNALE